MDRCKVGLRALLGPLDGHPEPLREDEAEDFLSVDVQLRAEAAADLWSNDSELGLGDPGDQAKRRAQDVGDLGRRPDRELARCRRGLDEDAARLDRVRDQAGLLVPLLDGDVGFVEEPIDFARRQLPRVGEVRSEVVVDDRSALREGLLDVSDRGKLLVRRHRPARPRPWRALGFPRRRSRRRRRRSRPFRERAASDPGS